MRVKRLIALALVAGMVAGGIGAADAAKKRKKKKKVRKIVKMVPTTSTFYLRRDGCNTDNDNARLSLEDGVDEGNLCGWLESGLLNEVIIQTEGGGQVGPVTDLWPASDGLPLTINAGKPLTGTINIVSSRVNAAPDNGLAVGQVTLDVLITGTSGGEATVIGSASETYTVAPDASVYPVEFEIDLADDLQKKVFTTVELATTLRGPAVNHGLYELDNPASTVAIPNFKKKVIKR